MARITDYEFGRVVVDGSEHHRDVIVLPNRVVGNWWRENGHSLVIADLEDVIDELPARLIVGCGAYGRLQPDPSTVESLRARGIDVDVVPTGEAVERFNASDPRGTAAALHLTC
jgi:hypothetical protein